MEQGMPEQSSVFAAEGSAAHELCAHCLKLDKDASAFLGVVIDIEEPLPGGMFGNTGEGNGSTRFRVTEEMVDAVQVYLDVVRSLFGKAKNVAVDVEQRLDMTHLHPEIFGTGDAVVYQHNTGHLHVVDFKYGKGVVVSPIENPQLMLYGAGAARKHGRLPINGITLHIVQPRAAGSPVRSWETDALTLLEFEDEIRRKAARVDEVLALPEGSDLSEYLSADDHCRFCKAAGICPALRQTSLTSALAEFADDVIVLPEPTSLSSDQLAHILLDAEMIGNWVKAVQAYAHAEAIAGRVPEGFKLVPKRSTRKWGDEAEACDLLQLFDVSPFAEPELKSPAQVEAAIGKKAFAKLVAEVEATGVTRFIVKESSGLNLVPASDARSAAKTAGLLDFDLTVET